LQLGAADRAAGEPGLECLLVHFRQLAQVECGVARSKSGFAGWVRKAIPWANLLAHVTTKDPLADEVMQLGREIASQFNGQVRNATARVQGAVGRDALRRTCFDAACTSAAVVGGEWRIAFQVEFEEQLAQQQP
jgi:hypothetical protein